MGDGCPEDVDEFFQLADSPVIQIRSEFYPGQGQQFHG